MFLDFAGLLRCQLQELESVDSANLAAHLRGNGASNDPLDLHCVAHFHGHSQDGGEASFTDFESNRRDRRTLGGMNRNGNRQAVPRMTSSVEGGAGRIDGQSRRGIHNGLLGTHTWAIGRFSIPFSALDLFSRVHRKPSEFIQFSTVNLAGKPGGMNWGPLPPCFDAASDVP
jgi:hypothetical protein